MASRRGGKRAGAGRPPVAPAERLKATMLMRFRPDELEALRELAASAGMTVGVYSREVLRRHLRRRKPR